ncbi:MAG: 3-dehydroquinate synthase [Bacteroidales bacterium]|nr:3-dehydroquinate synthase [Bacteroidales bacterium]
MPKTKLILPDSRITPLARLNRHLKSVDYKDVKFFILVDEHTYQHCLPQVVAQVEALQEAEFIEVPVGEECKNSEVAVQVWSSLLESGADRQSVIVNLGGGCVSDFGGFVAGTYKRGIRYVNIPTTLVGMVDAAIGGKTALNENGVKNAVGFIHHPVSVCVNPDFLSSLPESDLRAGSVELLKTLLIGGIIDTMPTHGWKQLITNENLTLCAKIKTLIVRQDPDDRDVRRILNLGHTFGHAVESYSHHMGAPLSHGFAVGVGMLCALYLSVAKLGLAESVYDNYKSWITELMPLPHYNLRDTQHLLELMQQDKKNANGEIRCVLLQDIGAAVVDVNVSPLEITDALLQVTK